MTVCGNRTDTPGFFTPCAGQGRRCVCGDQVAAELLDQLDPNLDTQETR